MMAAQAAGLRQRDEFLAMLGHELLANPEHLAGAEGDLGDIWRWHSVEELEHNTRYAFPDLDASPTKAWVVLNRESESGRRHYALAFAKRPAEELYDLRKDRDQLNNVVADPAYAAARARMADDLTARLKAAGDPRVCQNPIPFEQPPFTDPPAKKAPKRPVGAPLAPR